MGTKTWNEFAPDHPCKVYVCLHGWIAFLDGTYGYLNLCTIHLLFGYSCLIVEDLLGHGGGY